MEGKVFSKVLDCNEARSQKNRKMAKIATIIFVVAFLCFGLMFQSAFAASTYTLSNSYFNIQIGQYGDIYSLKLVNDAFPTNYVMNAASAPNQNTPDHEWMGELMFKYRLADADGNLSGAYTSAFTNQSSDVRLISQNSSGVTVNYANSAVATGIKNFSLTEKYSLVGDAFVWSITVKNTSSTKLEFGDFGLPMPFNEYWTVPSNTEIYETQVMHHSYVSNNGSYIYATRPSGIGNMLLMTPDQSTDAGFEYMDHWRVQEHPGTTWAQDQGGWANGLNVYYIKSNVIKSTNRGYLPNSSLVLDPGQSKTYTFNFYNVANQLAMQKKLYDANNIDVVSIPGMIFPTDMTAKVDLHTSQTINSLDLPAGATMVPDPTTPVVTDPNDGSTHNIYDLTLSTLGPNNVTVHFGGNKVTTLQFYAIEPVGDALQRHATFMVNNQQVNDATKYYNKIFDDWCMDAKKKRTDYQNPGTNAASWGDDWGWTHGEFLAEKEVYLPVPAEISAVDQYLETAIWGFLMRNHQTDYQINDWFTQTDSGSWYTRSFPYAHAWNTYFSMYKTEKLHPQAVTYLKDRNTYLLRAYNIFKVGIGLSMSTGLMGEQTDLELVQALRDEGYNTEANNAQSLLQTKYNNFMKSKYPFGSEYNFDNTGEESVFVLSRWQNNKPFMQLINNKTRACRGSQPLWYYYADPTTICGEAWWNFQYSVALIDVAMNYWILDGNSTQPEIDERMNYAAKLANLVLINSGQIDSDPANIGSVAWTYQSEKGDLYQTGGWEPGNAKLHNGFREMSGEADLGLWGEMRVLSSDVVVDPIFGLYGYGCSVTDNGTSYTVAPKDGINQRLNLITDKMSMTLGQDQYTQATIDYTNKNYVHFTLKNLDMTMHNTKITLTGLVAGTYDIIIDHTKLGSFNQVAGQTSTAILRLDAVATSDIEIKPGQPLTNIAPVVDAGIDSTVALPNTVTLNGTATDDTYPNGILTTTWSAQTVPTGAAVTIASASSLGTSVTVSLPGTYVFLLTASDGALQSTDTVTVTVNPAPPIPEVIANYLFNEASGTTASDSSGSGNNATLRSSTASKFVAPTDSAFTGSSYVPGNNGNVLSLDGTTNAYVTLPANIVKNVTDFTISSWVDVKTLGNYSRLFDFGTGTSVYMFFAPTTGGNSLFAISTSSNSAEQQLTGPVLTANKWHHVAITHQGNVGKLYIDGSLVSTNNNMTLSPFSLGATSNNWIGRSQWGDPILNGQVDNFSIYSRALSANEILTQAGLPLATSITSVVNPATVLVAQDVVPVPDLPSTVNAIYNNSTTSSVAVAWDAVDPALYTTEGTFTVNGTVLNVTTGPSVVVKVSPITSVSTPAGISTPVGNAPVLPATVRVTLKSGDTTNVPISWAVVNPASYAVQGTFQVLGTVPGTAFTAQVTVTVTASITGLVNPTDVVTPAGASPVTLFPAKVTANFSDGTTTDVAVTWSTPSALTYAMQNATPVTITGTVSGTTTKASIKFTVGPAAPKTVNDVYATTKVTVQPVLGTEFDAVYTDGSIGSVTVTWDAIDPADLAAAKTIDVIGHIAGSTVTVTAHVTITAADSGIAPLAPVLVSTIESVSPTMPATVTINYTDGSTKQLAVTWPQITQLQYNTVGTFTMQGTVNGALAGNNNPITVYAIVTVNPATLSSIAPIYQPTTLGVAPVLPATVNGTYSNGTVKATTVTWNLDPTKYNLTSYTVTGTVAGSAVQATAYVGVPVPGLALWYKMNENGGTTLYDSSFNNSNGTLNNTTTWTSGVNNGTDATDLGITPTNNYVTVPSNPGLESSNFTFSVWMKRTGSVSTEAVVYWNKANASYANSQGWYITFNSSLIVMLNNTTSFTVPSSTPNSLLTNTDTWYNIVVTWDNTAKTGKVYKNGVLIYTANVPTANVRANTGAKWLGFASPGYGGGYLNHMNLDDVRIYSTALDQTAITALYTNTPVITNISPVTATTTVNVAPTLPTSATAIYSDGSSKQFAVTWDTSALDLTKTGTTIVTGSGIVDGITKTATATVTVTSGYPVTITASPLVRAGGYITATYTAAPTTGVTYTGTAYLIVEVDNGSEPVSISSTKIDPASTMNRVDKFYVGSNNAGYSVKVYVTDVDATNPNLIPKIKGDQVIIQ